MSINFNHTIVYAGDSRASAKFLAEILGLPAPRRWGPFQVVTTDNGANIDFMDADGKITSQHYAFSSASQSSTEYLIGFANDRSRTGPTLPKVKRVRSIVTTAARFLFRRSQRPFSGGHHTPLGSGGWNP